MQFNVKGGAQEVGLKRKHTLRRDTHEDAS